MALENNGPYEIGCFSTLHPNRLVSESIGAPDIRRNLTELLPGPTPYATVPLANGVEMHYQPSTPDAPNQVAAGLAELFGFDGHNIRGVVHFTGNSAETDCAPGMDDETFHSLYEGLAEVCNSLDVRLWRQFRPDDLVSVRYGDLAQGDVYWFVNTAHRFMGFRDFPADSPTLQSIPDARILFCEDGFEITASGSFTEIADRAPAGYWQRTGNQLLPDGR
ncbi:hypothetical protein [Streptomyces sp. RKAG293]|uniref:hypothetical protein n=1 Tax=Streptomyces sp. RKAG293 TaxID=2893403 RepID=UPI00203322F4|nr:hypothetical protein [Streptomyces sp. RKAG293]MCM2424143.1 hypothetical protein [Streptomyces sp. RKAG293]